MKPRPDVNQAGQAAGGSTPPGRSNVLQTTQEFNEAWTLGYTAGYNQALDSVVEFLEGMKLGPDELRGVSPRLPDEVPEGEDQPTC